MLYLIPFKFYVEYVYYINYVHELTIGRTWIKRKRFVIILSIIKLHTCVYMYSIPFEQLSTKS